MGLEEDGVLLQRPVLDFGEGLAQLMGRLLRSICLGIDLYGSKMVGEGTNACEDNGHDGVPLVMRLRANVS